ncbi:predicted protein [Naegleria gruberi]|uniref:Predicted protein n=1 Tax=Naegleria gruberi TaxID=5762 RepID=D2V0G3_NAEGR|nr:uncharacterized protein NAEGRDRAFT_30058 [Naegleria gruberi]EFC49714.1 predicted protein [Naegleria gruberi]|eukprot:XP_002682458.1 predicted protein [Naegleria gruberi strain NEG-M]
MSLPNYSEAAERNKEPILQVLLKYLSNEKDSGEQILEIASGYGQHVSHFAKEFQNLIFHPSEMTDENFAIIKERTSSLSNVLTPTIIDISREESLPFECKFKAIIAINLVHISPFKCCTMLMKHASEILKSSSSSAATGNGYLFLYGPFNVNGEFTSEGNRNFDENLKLRNPLWGIRDVEQVEKEANQFGLKLIERVSMPANNFTLVFSL